MSKKFTILSCVICTALGVFADEFFHLRTENHELTHLYREISELRLVVAQASELAELRGSTTQMCILTLNECTEALDRALPIDRRELRPETSKSQFAQQRGP